MIDNDLDFNAAMSSPGNDPDFSAAMTPKKLGRPPKPKPAIDSNIYIYKDNKLNIDSYMGSVKSDIKENNNNNIKELLTAQEVNFLEIYFNSEHKRGKDRFTIDSAMISAGYGDFSQTTRYILARKIVAKYERQTGEARKIFPALGYGPVKVALGIIGHCEDSPPTVSLNALKLAAQCQGMIEQPDNATAGITINILTAPPPSPAGGPAAGGPAVDIAPSPAASPASPAAPRRPLQITR